MQPVYSVSDFIAVCNQVLDVSFGSVQITGELANIRVSKNRWAYFDLKDQLASLRFFGTVYSLPGPIEDGMVVTVRGAPQLHPRFGFSVTIQNIQLKGEGTIKKAASLLEQKLAKEGLFAPERKRAIPSIPERIGLITSSESAAYGDFVKVVSARWGLTVELYDVQVQGEDAPGQITRAIEYFSRVAEPPEVIVIIRGGGSADDLQAFSAESVTRAVAGSRIPTLVAVGHERDISLAEMAADQRASTPSNAAVLLVPDKKQVIENLIQYKKTLRNQVIRYINDAEVYTKNIQSAIQEQVMQRRVLSEQRLQDQMRNLRLLDPQRTLQRGYAIVRDAQLKRVLTSANMAEHDRPISIEFRDGMVSATVASKERQKSGKKL